MSIVFCPFSVPVIIKQTNQEGYILYVESGGQYDNDLFCIVLKESGELLHANTKQFIVSENVTFGIKHKKKSREGL